MRGTTVTRRSRMIMMLWMLMGREKTPWMIAMRMRMIVIWNFKQLRKTLWWIEWATMYIQLLFQLFFQHKLWWWQMVADWTMVRCSSPYLEVQIDAACGLAVKCLSHYWGLSYKCNGSWSNHGSVQLTILGSLNWCGLWPCHQWALNVLIISHCWGSSMHIAYKW